MTTTAITNAAATSLDSTEAFFGSPVARANDRKPVKRENLEVVARDGHPQHYSLLSIPLTDVYLDPKLDLEVDKSCI